MLTKAGGLGDRSTHVQAVRSLTDYTCRGTWSRWYVSDEAQSSLQSVTVLANVYASVTRDKLIAVSGYRLDSLSIECERTVDRRAAANYDSLIRKSGGCVESPNINTGQPGSRVQGADEERGHVNRVSVLFVAAVTGKLSRSDCGWCWNACRQSGIPTFHFDSARAALHSGPATLWTNALVAHSRLGRPAQGALLDSGSYRASLGKCRTTLLSP